MTESVTQTRPGDRNGRTPRAIEASGISKSFGGVRALHDASFAAEFGEVHALVGENGAGKSTMIKILSGVLKPDEGVVRVRGDEVDLSRPHDAQALGVATVFQELTLLPWMTVAENLLIGKEPRGPLPLIRRRALPGRAAEILAEHGVEQIDPLELVAALPLAQRQVLEIVRALVLEPRDPLPRRAHLGSRRPRGRVALRARARAAGARCAASSSRRTAGARSSTWPTGSPSSGTAST